MTARLVSMKLGIGPPYSSDQYCQFAGKAMKVGGFEYSLSAGKSPKAEKRTRLLPPDQNVAIRARRLENEAVKGEISRWTTA